MFPRIGITTGFNITISNSGVPVPRMTLDAKFCETILRAGGIPVLIAPTENQQWLERQLADLHGVILSGGADINPSRYRATTTHPATVLLEPRRENSDLAVLEYADKKNLPTLGICCGIQEMNVYRGGTLYQHLPDCGFSPNIVHRDGKKFSNHDIRVVEDSLLHHITRSNPMRVNSSHHQGLRDLGRDLRPAAWTADGLVEAVEDPGKRFFVGVQWHPEDMPDDPIQQRLFDAIVAECTKKMSEG